MTALSNSHFIPFTFLYKRLGECTLWAWEWKAWMVDWEGTKFSRGGACSAGWWCPAHLIRLMPWLDRTFCQGGVRGCFWVPPVRSSQHPVVCWWRVFNITVNNRLQLSRALQSSTKVQSSMFLKISETFFVPATNVACVAKWVNIRETWSCELCCSAMCPCFAGRPYGKSSMPPTHPSKVTIFKSPKDNKSSIISFIHWEL